MCAGQDLGTFGKGKACWLEAPLHEVTIRPRPPQSAFELFDVAQARGQFMCGLALTGRGGIPLCLILSAPAPEGSLADALLAVHDGHGLAAFGMFTVMG